MHHFYLLIIIFLFSGCVVGILSGLIGIGGGLVVVPLVSWVLLYYGIPMTLAAHMAVGTSLGVMIFSSSMSVYTHHKNNNVPWDFVRKLVCGFLIGAALGAMLSAHMPGALLHKVFAVFVFISAIQMAINAVPTFRHRIQNACVLTVYGIFSGTLSACLGIGGSIVNVPFYKMNGMPMKKCAATSSASSLPIAIVGVSNFIFSGMGVAGLPKGSVGFVNIPIVCLLSIGSIFSARIGAKWANKANDRLLRLVFAVFLVLVGISMLWS